MLLSPALQDAIYLGFGERVDGEDRFDAVIGLFGMIDIVRGRDEAGECNDRVIRTLEGWILGQRPPTDSFREAPADAATAYRQSTFWAFTTDDAIAIRDGEPSPQLDQLLDCHRASNWAYITAHNPGGEPARTTSENAAAQAARSQQVEASGYPAYRGIGVGDDGGWPPEDSLLILGISAAAATNLGRTFVQHGIVVGERGGRASVALLA